jgi:hypothetical protein
MHEWMARTQLSGRGCDEEVILLLSSLSRRRDKKIRCACVRAPAHLECHHQAADSGPGVLKGGVGKSRKSPEGIKTHRERVAPLPVALLEGIAVTSSWSLLWLWVSRPRLFSLERLSFLLLPIHSPPFRYTVNGRHRRSDGFG